MWQFRIEVKLLPDEAEINGMSIDMPPDRWEWRVYINGDTHQDVMMAGGITDGRKSAILAGTKWLTEYATEEY